MKVSAKSETLKPFCLLFCTGMSKDFHQLETHSIESRCVIGLQNILFVGAASMHLSRSGNFTGSGSEGVKMGSDESRVILMFD